jgi:carbon storage regulator
MLVLERREDQGFWIGDDVYVTVVAIKGSRVKLGIDAPRGTVIAREELLTKNRHGEAPPPALTSPSRFPAH